MNRVEPSIGSITFDEGNPYAPSEAVLREDVWPRQTAPRFFDFSGRLSLSRFWLLHLVFCVYIPYTLLFTLYLGLRHNLYVLIGAGLVVVIPTALAELSLLLRRARDVGMHPVWGVVALFVPLVGTLVWLFLALIPGGKGSNRYGAANRPLPLGARLLTLILLVMAPGVGVLIGLAYPELMASLGPAPFW